METGQIMGEKGTDENDGKGAKICGLEAIGSERDLAWIL